MLEKILKAWLWLGAGLLGMSVAGLFLRQPRPLTDFFFVFQDMPILTAILLIVVTLRLIPGVASRAAAYFEPRVAIVLSRTPPWAASPVMAIGCLALMSGLIGWVGAYLIYDNYALSLDEFMATFGAAIHRHGQLMAPVPAQWQDYVWALQPQFAFATDDGAFWGSSYLPVNAGLRGAAAAFGAESLVSPLLAAISVTAIWAVGRRIWPDRPAMALIAAALLATSSQFLITAMTPYAMTAHLAFNLVWLWLFLRGGRLGHAGAIAMGFLACGVHQLLFHPLFAAPFVLQLWLERRWRAAALYSVAYAAICLFWIDYWPIALGMLGEAPAAAPGAGGAVGGFGAHALALAATFDPAALGLMAKNLIRLITWQNPLTAPLVALGGVAAFRANGTLRSLILGLGLTMLAMFILIPYQGHGWGYRYLHGFLGSACLLAVWEWTCLTDHLDGAQRVGARVAFGAVTAAALLILLPIRAWQAHDFLHPYALANAAIRRANAQVVLVDNSASWFTTDLVRNDPYLTNRPVVLSLGDLEKGQARDLCARYTVSIFDTASSASFGIRTVPAVRPSPAREALRGLTCGTPARPIGEFKG